MRFGFEHTRFWFGSGSVTAKVRFGSVSFLLSCIGVLVRFGSFKNEFSSSVRVRFYSHLYMVMIELPWRKVFQ